MLRSSSSLQHCKRWLQFKTKKNKKQGKNPQKLLGSNSCHESKSPGPREEGSLPFSSLQHQEHIQTQTILESLFRVRSWPPERTIVNRCWLCYLLRMALAFHLLNCTAIRRWKRKVLMGIILTGASVSCPGRNVPVVWWFHHYWNKDFLLPAHPFPNILPCR